MIRDRTEWLQPSRCSDQLAKKVECAARHGMPEWTAQRLAIAICRQCPDRHASMNELLEAAERCLSIPGYHAGEDLARLPSVSLDKWHGYVNVLRYILGDLSRMPMSYAIRLIAEEQKIVSLADLLIQDAFGDPWCRVLRQPATAQQFIDAVKMPKDAQFLLDRQRTPDIIGLAEQIWQDMDWRLMPVLADALADAGNESEELLRHLRGDVRCYVCHGDGVGEMRGGGAYAKQVKCPRCRGEGWRPGMIHDRCCWALRLVGDVL